MREMLTPTSAIVGMGLSKSVACSPTAASPAPPRAVRGHISPSRCRRPDRADPGGDQITVDIEGGAITLHVDDDEMAARRAAFVAPVPKHNHGVLAKYAKLVSSADKGAYVS